jgi:hypothetical protein
MIKWFRFWRRRLLAPPDSADNPGNGPTAKLAFSRDDKSWTEEVDAVDSLAHVLTGLGHGVTVDETHVRHAESGLVFQPQVVAVYPLEKGGVRTVTTIETSHPDLVPDGVFEFQHATGEDTEGSFRTGFDQWARTDLVALKDALRDTPESCMTLRMSIPGRQGAPPRHRRAILGPVAHFVQNPPPEPEAGSGDEHAFCPCCLVTRSFEAFKVLFEGGGFFAVRLFAARDVNGQPQADCRVNGADWEPGAEALRRYVRTWPGTGYEFRKQYVILHSTHDPGGEAGSPPGA